MRRAQIAIIKTIYVEKIPNGKSKTDSNNNLLLEDIRENINTAVINFIYHAIIDSNPRSDVKIVNHL